MMNFAIGILFGLVCAGAALYWQRTRQSDSADTDEDANDHRRRQTSTSTVGDAASSDSYATQGDTSSSGSYTTQGGNASSSDNDSGRSRQPSSLLEESYQELNNTRRNRDSTPAHEPNSDDTDEGASLQSSSTPEPLDRIESGAHDTLGADSTVPNRPSILDATEESSAESLGDDPRNPDDPATFESSDAASHESEATADSDLHWLVGLVGEVEDETFHLGHDELTLGRSPRCDIQVTQGEISRTHCRLHSSDEALELETTQTVNETLVDGSVVQPGECVELEDGDIVEIGGVAAFEYHREGDFECDTLDEHDTRRGIGTDTNTIGAGGENLARRIENALERTNNDLDRAASMLGVEPDNLAYLMETFDIDEP